NWDEDYISKIGCTVIHEAYQFEIENHKILVAHGDGLKDPEFNFPRPAFHRLLRNPYFVKVYKALTGPAMGNQIMKIFSGLNRSLAVESESDTIKIDTWATSLLTNFNYDVV